MQHRKLGNSDLELPVVTFGAWAIGGLFWGGTDDDEAIKAIQASIDHGVDAIDTAPTTLGTSLPTAGESSNAWRGFDSWLMPTD